MPKVEEYQLRPFGWDNDPEEERIELSTLDYLSAMVYNNYALFFRLDDKEKSKVAEVLKEGLERTLGQAKHLVGTIEKGNVEKGKDDRYFLVKKKDSTVKFVVQHLDSPEDQFPTFDKIEKAHFIGTALGDIKVLSNAPMTYGEKPEAHPDCSPVIASYKANFIPGGLIFNMHSHHYSNDVVGWGNFTHQLADNCYAILNKTEAPSFDPRCLDRSRFISQPVPEGQSVEAPPQADRNPKHKPSQSLVFHLPKSKAAELKKAAWPSDGSWISTYDAISALMWRTFTKIREPLYQPDPDSYPIWAEAATMSKRLKDPPLPDRVQGNTFFATMSATAAVPQLNVAQIVSEVPLSKLASYVRQMTNGVTPDMLFGALDSLAPIRNKQNLAIRINSFDPMTLVMTDWRDSDVCKFDFGFGKPVAFRHLFDDIVTEGLAIVYPPHNGPAGDDEGIEVQVSFEKELTQQLVADPEWSKYFEFRGVDAVPAGESWS